MIGLSSLVKCSWARPEAYPRVDHLKGLTCKYLSRLERLARNKHSSLLDPPLSYEENRVS
jgi:hypothetical protein